MVKKRIKATLSFDADIYKNFQKYCDDNAIMLSRTIEIFMNDFYKKRKKKMSLVLLFLGLFLIMGGLGSATTIASDNFECGSGNFSCGSGWNSNWSVSGDCVVTSLGTVSPIGAFHLRGQENAEGSCIADRNFNNVDYTYSNVSFFAAADSLDVSGDFCRYYYYNGSAYIQLLEFNDTSDDGVYRQYNFSVEIYGLSSNAGIRMKQFGVGTDNCYLDNINISGFSSSGGDTTSPNVSLISPSNGTTLSSNLTYFAAAFSDNINVSNATLYVWNSTSLVGSNFTNLGNSSISVNLSFILPREGTYFWNYLALDNSSNSAFNHTNFTIIFSLPDTTPPAVTINFPVNNTLYNTLPLNFNVSLNENGSIVMYTLDNGVTNITMSSIDNRNYNVSNHSISDGIYTFKVYANDTSGNRNDTTSATFIVDTTKPSLIIFYPLNTSYNINVSELNYTVSDTNLQACWYSLNNGADNTTIVCGSNLTGLNSNEGSNKWTVYANDSAGNENSSSVTFFKDTIIPTFTSIPSDVAITYGEGFGVDFDAVDANFAFFSINWTSLFVINQSGFLRNNTILAAGTYKINVSINDSLNNYNSTIFTVTVNKALGNISLLLNGLDQNQTSSYGNITNASASTLYGTITLYRNGQDVTSENSLNKILAVEDYNYTAISSGDENHSSVSITRWTHIKRALSSCSISSNPPQEYPSPVNVTGNCNHPESLANLYRDNSQVNSENGANKVLGVGSYVYMINVTESQNYTSANNSVLVIVNQNSSYALSISGTSPIEYPQITDAVGSGCPPELSCSLDKSNGIYGAGTIVFNYSSQGNANYTSNSIIKDIVISRNSSYVLGLIATPSSGIYPTQTTTTGSSCPIELNCSLFRDSYIKSNPETVVLGAATYNYTYNTSANANYTSKSISISLDIAQNTSSKLSLFLNNSQNNITLITGNSIMINVTLDIGEGIIELYKNSTLINSGNSSLSNLTLFNLIGLYNITAIYPGNENYSIDSETWFVNVAADLKAPEVRITYPINTTYNANVSELNYTVSDTNLQACWYSLNNGADNTTIVCGSNLTGLNSNEGSNKWTVYANDSAGNENSSSVSFTVNLNLINLTGITPSVRIFYPSYASTYGDNSSIALNFSVNGQNIDTCWYNLNSQDNLTLPECVNTTFYASNGLHNLVVYANESIEGLKNSTSTAFFVNSNKPTIHLLSPVNNFYTNNSTINLKYIPTSSSLDSCELWGDFNGTYLLIQINSSVVSGIEQTFSASNLTEGNYSWAITCNSGANYSTTGNRSFYSDYQAPNVSLQNSVSGTQTSATVNFEYSINDSIPTTCTFNVTSLSTGIAVFKNITQRCDNVVILFSVNNLANGYYQSTFVATDAAGNSETSITTFTVIINPESSGGGGGSSGGGIALKNVTKETKIEFLFLDEPIFKRGTSGNVKLQAINTGNIFLNNCKLKFGGNIATWFKNDEVKGLGEGEKFVYNINVNIPDEGEPGEFNSNVEMICDEGSGKTSIKVNVYRNAFEGEIGEYERVGGNLKFYYNLKEYSGEDHDISIFYEMTDLDNITRYKGQASTKLRAKEEKKEGIEFKLPKDSFGEFVMAFRMDDGISLITKEKKIFLPSSTSPIGLVVSADARKRLSTVGIILISLVVLFFAVRFIYKYHRKSKVVYGHGLKFRKLIKLEL